MRHFNIGQGHPERKLDPQTEVTVYSREAFRAILARHTEGEVRTALEEGNIPRSNIEHAVEWLREQESRHHGYWM